MATEALKMMKDQLMSCVQSQLGDIKNVDAHELGEAVDMIKDLAEAIYYCTITEAMEKSQKQEQKETVNNINYYTMPLNGGYNKTYPDYYRDMERQNGYMYYPNNSVNTMGKNNTNGMNNSMGMETTGNEDAGMVSHYTEMPYEMRRDPREGRAAIRRRMYMEGKEMHKDTNSQLKELEEYLKELSTDITEMVKDASPEERATLHQKMMTLASKI